MRLLRFITSFKSSFKSDCDLFHNIRRLYFIIGKSVLPALLIFAVSIINVFAESPQKLAVPATFIRELQLPGSNNHFLRPGRILTDNVNNEVYICDPGNSRILIFNTDGLLKYEFSVADFCGAPTDIAIDSSGFIYVLGSTRTGKKLFVFDYDGEFINPLPLKSGNDDLTPNIQSILIDKNNNLIVLDGVTKEILCCSVKGQLRNRFSIFKDDDNQFILEQVVGSINVSNNIIYVPVSSLGEIYKLSLDGIRLGRIGHKGSTPGDLNFPVSVAVTNDGIVMVLDKHRYNVVCYTEKGKFLGEFGGKGINPGWFYHPTWLAVDNKNQAYIGQIFNNKVQVCVFPEFIRERKNQIEDMGGDISSDTNQPDHLSGSNPKLLTRGDILTTKEAYLLSHYAYREIGHYHFYHLGLQTNWRFLTCVS